MPERQCNKCVAIRKKEWGCEEDAPVAMVIDGEEHWRCPRRPILEEPRFYETVFVAYRSYIRGYLPDPGGIEDQGYKFVQSVMIIDAALAEAQAEAERRERKKTARKAGSSR